MNLGVHPTTALARHLKKCVALDSENSHCAALLGHVRNSWVFATWVTVTIPMKQVERGWTVIYISMCLQ